MVVVAGGRHGSAGLVRSGAWSNGDEWSLGRWLAVMLVCIICFYLQNLPFF